MMVNSIRITPVILKLIRKKYKFVAIVIFFLSILFSACCDARETECVILLHGLGRSHYSMSFLAYYLRLQHYVVINQDYPTTKKSTAELADVYLTPMINTCHQYQANHIHFVTHSLGGIVLRAYLQKHPIPNIGKIVMLAPPNHGSQVADLLHDNWFYRHLLGPVGQELTTKETSVPNQLPHFFPYQTGIIAGSLSFNPFGRVIFHDDNDGLVSVSSAHLDNVKHFIILPVTHTFIMQSYLVARETSFFLQHGKFFQ